MSILDEVIQAKRGPGSKCSVGSWLASLDNKARAEWEAVFADDTLGHTQIHRVMKRHGFPTDTQAVSRHRGGVCRCGVV